MLFWPELAQEWHSPPTPREQAQLARQLKAQETLPRRSSPLSAQLSPLRLLLQLPSSPSPNFLPVLFREAWMQMTQESSSSQYACFCYVFKSLLNTNSYKKNVRFYKLKKSYNIYLHVFL